MLLFHHSSRKVKRRNLRAFWLDLSRRLAPGACCLIATDAELRALNRRFRGKDAPADVLSFPSSNGSAGNGAAGEIAISFDRAAEQAAEMGHSVEAELQILMLHGLLHLAGMDHETDRGEMARAERRWRGHLGLPMGLIERVR